MPKSKRNKQISLTQTKKNGMESKKHLVEEVRSCVDNYANLYVYSVNDMRNSKLKYVREQWKHSRFFFGKNNVMALALGKMLESEYRDNLHKVSQCLKGQCGLLFSNKSKDEVLNWFEDFSETDYSRSGNIAQYTVKLSEGPLPQFAHSLEPYLRQLGMPTTLQKGIVHLVKDYEVCKEGEKLTPETAKILKLLGHQMAEFKISIVCCWSNDGMFQQIKETGTAGCEIKENIQMDIDIQDKDVKEDNSPEEKLNDKPENEANSESEDYGEDEDIDEEEIRNSILKNESFKDVLSSPDEKSPIFRALRNRTIQFSAKKKKPIKD